MLGVLPFGDDSFDVVVCSHVLEHIPADVTVAREMARVLTRDGVALIQVPVDPNLETTYETFAPRRPTMSASTGSTARPDLSAGDQ